MSEKKKKDYVEFKKAKKALPSEPLRIRKLITEAKISLPSEPTRQKKSKTKKAEGK